MKTDKSHNDHRFAKMESNPAYLYVRNARRAGEMDNRIRNLLVSAIINFKINTLSDLKKLTDSDLCSVKSCGKAARGFLNAWLETIPVPSEGDRWVKLSREIDEFCDNMRGIERGSEKWPKGASEILRDRITNNAYIQLSEALNRARDGTAATPVDLEVLRSFMEWNKEHANRWNQVTSLDSKK